MRFLQTFQLYDFLDTLVSLLTAFVLGTLIGAERQYRQRSAGLRTNVLVAVGASAFVDLANRLAGAEGSVRVIAYVVSGIGFLGAGSILARGEIIKGLTTAASIWTVAAIGLAIGGGLYFAGTASTILILIILAGVKPLEEAYRARNQTVHFKITAERGALSPEELRQTLSLRVSQIKRFVVENRSGDEGNDEILVLLNKVSSQDIADFKNRLNEVPAIRRVDLISRSAADNSSAT